MKSGCFDIEGSIIDARRAVVSNNSTKVERDGNAPRSFTVQGDEGGVYLRNAKYLKLNNIESESNE